MAAYGNTATIFCSERCTCRHHPCGHFHLPAAATGRQFSLAGSKMRLEQYTQRILIGREPMAVLDPIFV